MYFLFKNKTSGRRDDGGRCDCKIKFTELNSRWYKSPIKIFYCEKCR